MKYEMTDLKTKNTSASNTNLNEFLITPEKRIDYWSKLHRIAMAWQKAQSDKSLHDQAATILASMAPLEDLCGYPGPSL